MNTAVSVIIRTKNEGRHLEKVLRTLKKQQYPGSVEIVVVDSGSTDATVLIAQAFGCRIITMKPGEFSFGRALNRGIENAGGEIIINLSGHSVPVGTDYFQQMVEPFSDPRVAATFGRDVPWPDACPSQARDISNHFPEAGPDGNKFSNANAALRREIWEAIRFDEQLLACEDVLWARNVMDKGYQILYVPEGKVFHSHTSSLRYIFRRYLKERRSLKSIADLPDVKIADIYRRYVLQTRNDFDYVKEKGYGAKWYFHIPLYRFMQELGLYLGSKSGRQGKHNG